eukprot:m.52042 g.52042  ORF g.52042 m.52042 type:complete len:665 (+) comp18231_c0_seq1:78-2072(+)
MVSKIAEVGWLYRRVRSFVRDRSSDRAFGLVGQALCAVVQQELDEYFRLLSILEAQIHPVEEAGRSHSTLTLTRLMVWTHEPLTRMRVLASMIDNCTGHKGGALASVMHQHTKHGDPYIRALVARMLKAITRPIHTMLARWIYDGDLNDPYLEFFVAADETVTETDLWRDKYSIRSNMVPIFVPQNLANKILLIGKSINFIRHTCRVHDDLQDTTAALRSMQGGFSDLQVLQSAVNQAYHLTSRRLLEILHTRYHLLQHLDSMRKYLLLGQGDFIHHLLAALEPELCKPAEGLMMHNMTAVVDGAVRATNAHLDRADNLQRLDVQLMEASPGDCGWDVFSLTYHVDGPLSTVITAQGLAQYLRVFNFLWRVKRIEYSLSKHWSAQMTYSRALSEIPEMRQVLKNCHMVATNMVHFVNQVQHYLLFEVLECSWDQMLTEVKEAGDLDDIIYAHDTFLQTIITRALLGPESKPILSQLRSIFDLILRFQKVQEGVYADGTTELDRRNRDLRRVAQRAQEGTWGLTEEDTAADSTREARFIGDILPRLEKNVAMLTQEFEQMVGRLLLMMCKHSDANLRFLSVRIDFNEHYKSRVPELRAQLNSPFKSRPTRPIGHNTSLNLSGLGSPSRGGRGLLRHSLSVPYPSSSSNLVPPPTGSPRDRTLSEG